MSKAPAFQRSPYPRLALRSRSLPGVAIGRTTEKAAPLGSLAVTNTLPPWASTSLFTIESPRPVPSCSRAEGPRSTLEFREIEQAHDELEELFALLVDRLDELQLVADQLPGNSFDQHFAVADDRRERRAGLVGDDPEEVRLEPIELAQLVE